MKQKSLYFTPHLPSSCLLPFHKTPTISLPPYPHSLPVQTKARRSILSRDIIVTKAMNGTQREEHSTGLGQSPIIPHGAPTTRAGNRRVVENNIPSPSSEDAITTGSVHITVALQASCQHSSIDFDDALPDATGAGPSNSNVMTLS